jgi:hypothetical protein
MQCASWLWSGSVSSTQRAGEILFSQQVVSFALGGRERAAGRRRWRWLPGLALGSSDDFVAVLLNSRAAESRGGQVVGLQQASVIAPLAAQGVAKEPSQIR